MIDTDFFRLPKLYIFSHSGIDGITEFSVTFISPDVLFQTLDL